MNVNPTSSNVNDYLSMPLSMPGLASGMDWQSVIQKLMSVSEEPLKNLEAQKTSFENEQNALEENFKPMLEDFRQSLMTLELQSTFLSKSSSVSDTSILDATATSTALTGNYQIKVDNMATFTTLDPSKTVGSAIDPTKVLSSLNLRTAVTTGYITINGVQINIDPSTQSLNDVISAINNSSAGVTASYDSTNDKLVLTGNGSAVINVGSPTDTSDFLQAMYLDNAPQILDANGNTTVSSTVHLGAISTSSTLSSLDINSGNISINGIQIAVDSTQTLDSLIAAVNSSSANVTAWYDSNADKVYVRSNIGGPVSITAAEADAANPTNVISTFGWGTAATQAAGQNAQIEISSDNGSTWTTYARSTNTITDVLSGVTLTLHLASTTPTTLTISQDTSTAVSAVQNFVNSFNNIVNWINTQYSQQPPQNQTTTTSGSAQGALYNNEMLDSVLSKMKNMVYQMVPELSKYNSLPSIGISTGAVGSGWYQTMVGTLSLDENKLTQALQDDPQQVYELFANDPDNSIGNPNAGKGIVQQLDDNLYTYTQYNGLIDQYASTQGYLGSRLLSLNSQIIQTAKFLKEQQTYYIQQYTAMERMLSGLSGQSSFISSLSSPSSNT